MKKGIKERTTHKVMKSIDKVYDQFPSFEEIFDEETWYQFCFVFVACTVVCVFILARYVEIRSQDPLDRDHGGIKRKVRGERKGNRERGDTEPLLGKEE